MIENREAVQQSVIHRGRETPVYVIKNLYVISFRKDSLPSALKELLNEQVRTVDESWSRDFLKNRGCLVVSANEDNWIRLAGRLRQLRENGTIWALGQVVKFDPSPKSPWAIVLDRVSFDLAEQGHVDQVRDLGAKTGFRVEPGEKRPAGFPGGSMYVAVPEQHLTVMDLITTLARCHQVTGVQPTWVSPLNSRAE